MHIFVAVVMAADQTKHFSLPLLYLLILFMISAIQENDGFRSARLLPARHTVHQHVSQHQV